MNTPSEEPTRNAQVTRETELEQAQSSLDPPPGVFASSTAGTPAVTATGTNGADGVDASSDSGAGVSGTSTGAVGVSGTSTSSTGVNGTSTSGTGVNGTSADGVGVSGASIGSTGVSGTSTSGVGVSGTSTSSTGVSGTSADGVGVSGTSTNSAGVSGHSTNGTGVSGSSARTGVFGTSANGIAVHGFSTDGHAGVFDGTVLVNGNFSVTGTKNFVQAHPTDPGKEIVYVALEGGEARTYVCGSGQLQGGKAVLALPEHFGLVTATAGLTVQLTPRGEWLQLYVVELDTAQLVVREAQGKSGAFDYLVYGVRRGYEQHEVIRTKR